MYIPRSSEILSKEEFPLYSNTNLFLNSLFFPIQFGQFIAKGLSASSWFYESALIFIQFPQGLSKESFSFCMASQFLNLSLRDGGDVIELQELPFWGKEYSGTTVQMLSYCLSIIIPSMARFLAYSTRLN
jgi:hypothetical protein